MQVIPSWPILPERSSIILSHRHQHTSLKINFHGYKWSFKKRSIEFAETIEKVFVDFTNFCDTQFNPPVLRVKEKADRIKIVLPGFAKELSNFLIYKLIYNILNHCSSCLKTGEFNVLCSKNERLVNLTNLYSYPIQNYRRIDELLYKPLVNGKVELKKGINSHRLKHLFDEILGSNSILETPLDNCQNWQWRMEILYVSQSSIYNSLHRYLELVAQKEEFQLVKLPQTSFSWLRDLYFEHPTQPRQIMPTCFTYKEFFNELASLRNTKDEIYGTSDPYLFSKIAQHQKHLEFFNENLQVKNPLKISESLLYFEGGNLLNAVNERGETTIICGAHNLLASFLMAERSGLFNQSSYRTKIRLKLAELTRKQVFKFSMLLQSGLILQETLYPNEPPVSQQLVKEAIAKIEVIKDLFRAELGEKILFLESKYGFEQHQIDFHLDMVMMPSVDGVIFLQSYEKCAEVLKNMIFSGRLNGSEREVWKAYLENAYYGKELYEARLEAIKEELTAANFKVVSVPGYYPGVEDETNETTTSIHYLNGIVAKGKNGNFVICNGFKGKLPGEAFLKFAYSTYLKKHHIQNVYFTRNIERQLFDQEPANETAFNMMYKAAGLHCFTQRTWGKKPSEPTSPL